MKQLKLFFLCLALFSFSHNSFAETTTKPLSDINTEAQNKSLLSNSWWLNVGLGGSKNNSNDLEYISAYSSINYMPSETRLLTFRVISANEFVLFSPPGHIKDIGIMYGLIKKKQYYYASITGGLGYFQYQKESSCYSTGFFGYTCSENKTHRTIGVPGEIQLFLTPTPYVGIGVVGFGNVNTVKSYAGAALALQVGNLW